MVSLGDLILGLTAVKVYGPADYLTIASTFSTMIITSIPILKLSARDQARRFISLIDALYEARCKLICIAQSNPEDIFFPDALQKAFGDDGYESDIMMIESVSESRDVYRPNVSSYRSPEMAQEPAAPSAIALDQLSIFSGTVLVSMLGRITRTDSGIPQAKTNNFRSSAPYLVSLK